MKKSRYTFYVPKAGSDDLLVINYLSGAVDLVESSDKSEFMRRFEADLWDGYGLFDYMKDRGYLVESEEAEEEHIRSRFIEFQEEYDKTAIQLIFSLNYTCNFKCTYCFQEEYLGQGAATPIADTNTETGSEAAAPKVPSTLTNEITDAFFKYINNRFGAENVKPYITLFGGEPLLGGESYKKNLRYFLEQAKKYNYAIAVVTNGYELINYLSDFERIGSDIKEIQVTLDGGREMHNQRRLTKSGEASFDRIAEGIDAALKKGYRINLRTIVDKENLGSLPDLAEFALKKGWLHYPSDLFETQLGRNYELHSCQKTDNLYGRAEMWSDYLDLARTHPILMQYTKPQFHGMRYLKENGELPFPIFDGCPAGKKEWAFDLRGDIYGCTASVGVDKYKLGSYIHPEEPINEDQIFEWETRDVLAIDECRSCAISLSCGGGCGVIAANKTGKIHSPDCRPVKELVSIGAAYYNVGE
jgi:uncharacterized protein